MAKPQRDRFLSRLIAAGEAFCPVLGDDEISCHKVVAKPHPLAKSSYFIFLAGSVRRSEDCQSTSAIACPRGDPSTIAPVKHTSGVG